MSTNMFISKCDQVFSCKSFLLSSVRTYNALKNSNACARSYSYKNHVGSEPLKYITLGEVLATSAERWPDRPAVISRQENKTMTFSQILEEADTLAAGLRVLGLKSGDCLGIWSPNCTQWVVAMMAAARSGLISVAMNPNYKKREIEYCLKKVGVKAIIAQESVTHDNYHDTLREVIPELASSNPGDITSSNLPDLKSVILITDKHDLPGIISYDKLLEMASPLEIQNISREIHLVNPDSGCNIQFTSGTTGTPKAALLSHHGIVNNGYFIGARNELNQGRKTICVQVPLFHVFGVVVTISAAFQHGSTIVFPSFKYNPSASIEAIAAEKCNVIHGTPTMYVDLLNQIRDHEGHCIKAEIAVTGGSPVTPQLVQDLSKILNVNRVKSIFGMTECTAVNFQSLPGEDKDRPLHYLGHVQDHLEVKVVDEHNNLVEFGKPGELLTRGYSLMKGYWGDEAKTKEIIDDQGWLRTGDQIILHEDGYGQIVGRIKDLIIRGGENIAPKEIEDIVCSHPDVLECQVFGVQDNRLGEEVFAAVRLKDGIQFDEKKLKQHCLQQLAKFKVPKVFKHLDDFPKTTSGKVQKYRLRDMVESGLI